MDQGDQRQRQAMEDELDQRLAAEREDKVRELFHRLDIPLEDIPVSSLLPWQSFQPLLDGHFGPHGISKTPLARAKKQQQNQTTATASGKIHHDSGIITREASPHHTATSSARRVLFRRTGPKSHLAEPTRAGARGGEVASPVTDRELPLASTSAYNHQLHNLGDLQNGEREILTIENTLQDMKLVARRLDGITKALNLGKSFRHITSTSIEDDPLTDPELMKIHDLQHQLNRVMSDVAGHVNHINRLHDELKRRDVLIAGLYRELEEERALRLEAQRMRRDDNGGNDSDDDQNEGAQQEEQDGSVSANSSFSANTTSDPLPKRSPAAAALSKPSNNRRVAVHHNRSDEHESPLGSVGHGTSKAMETLVHPKIGLVGYEVRTRLASALQLYRTLVVDDPDSANNTQMQRRRAAMCGGPDALSDLFALVPVMRVVPPPTFVANRLLLQTHCYMAVAIPQPGPQSTEVPMEPAAWNALLTQSFAFIESVILRYGGTLACNVHGKQTAVFADPVLATQCALEIQMELPNTTAIAYPPTLDTALETAKNPHATHPKYIWRGYRPVISLDISTAAMQDCSRDVVGNGGVIYSGEDLHRMRWIAAHYPYGGIILTTSSVHETIETNSIELEEPLSMFWQWQMVPGGEAKAMPMYAVFHRSHYSRISELQHALRHHYTDHQFAVITDPDNQATLERLVAVNNAHASRHGAKVVTKDDASILGVEGATVEQRLKHLRTIPAAAAGLLLGPDTSPASHLESHQFLSHIPRVDELSTDTAPSGDQTLILFMLPCYQLLVEVLDDSAAQTVYRRAAKVVRDTIAEMTSCGIVEVRASREKILLSCSDPIDAVKMCFAAQRKLLSVQWPRDMTEFASVVSREERWHGKLVDGGPASSFCIHFAKVTAMKDIVGDGTTYYSGPDVDMLLHLTSAAPEGVSSIIMSEIAFALIRQRIEELDDMPFVESVGLISRSTSSPSPKIGQGVGLSPVFSVTPRDLVGRCVLYPSAMWSLQKDRMAHKYSKRGRLTQAMMVKVLGERLERPKIGKPLHAAHRRYLLEQDANAHCGLVVPSVECLTHSATITATKTQSAAAYTYFEWSKVRSHLEGVQLTLLQMIRQSHKDADGEALRATECCLMQHHDSLLPKVMPLSAVQAEAGTLIELLQVMQGKGTRMRRESFGSSRSTVGLKRRMSVSVNAFREQLVTPPAQAAAGHAPAQLFIPPTQGRGGGVRQIVIPPTPGRGPTQFLSTASSATTTPVASAGAPKTLVANSNNNTGSPGFVSGSEALAMLEIDKERQYLLRRSRSMETEVVCTHMIAQQFHKLTKSYLASLLDSSQPIVPSEEVVLRLMQKILAVRGRQKKLMGDQAEEEDEGEGSSSSEVLSDEEEDGAGVAAGDKSLSGRPFEIRRGIAPHVNMSTAWNDVLMQLVDLKDNELSDYDPILLCRSLVAQLAHQFLFLRNIANRFSRTSEQLEKTRQMDPGSKMGRAVRAAADTFRQKRLEDSEQVRGLASQFVALPEPGGSSA